MSNKEKLLASAQKFLQKGQVARAVKDYQKIVEQDPRDFRSRQKLAELYSREKRVEEALQAYEAVARHYADSGFYLKAIAVYKQMQKVEPSRVEVYHRLAELNEKQGLIGNALAEYRSLVAYYEKNGMPSEAVKVLLQMKALEPENHNIQVKIAETYAAAGFFEDGYAAFQEARDELSRASDASRVGKLYELFQPYFSQLTGFQVGQAEFQIEQGEGEKGLETLRSLLRNEPDDTGILEALARSYRSLEDFENERLTLSHLLKIEPEKRAYREEYIRACLAQDEAVRALEGLEEWKDDFLAADQSALVKAFYEDLLQRLPAEERVINTLQTLYEQSGEGDKYLDMLEKKPAAEEPPVAEPPDTDSSESPDSAAKEASTLEAGETDVDQPGAGEDPVTGAPRASAPVDADAGEAVEEIPLDFLEEADAISSQDGGEAERDAAGTEAGEVELELELDLELEPAEPESETAPDLSAADAGTDDRGPEDRPEELPLEDLAEETNPAGETAEPESAEELILEETVVEEADAAGGAAQPEAEPAEALSLEEFVDTETDAAGEPAAPDDEFTGELSLDDLVGEDQPADDEALVLEDAIEEEPAGEDRDAAEELLLDEVVEEPAAATEEPVTELSGADLVHDQEPSSAIEDAGREAGELAEVAVLRELDEAEFYLQQGLYDEARRICRELLERDPGCTRAEEKLAEIAAQKDAAASTDEAGEEYFDFAGEILGEADAAIAYVEQHENSPFRLDGVFSDVTGEVEDQVDPEDSESHYNLGIAYKEMGLLEDAVAEFEKAMRNPERLLAALTLKGVCLAEKGQLDAAEEAFEAGLERSDLSPEGRMSLQFELGLLYQNANRPADALEVFRQVAGTDPFFRDVGEKIAGLETALGVTRPGNDDDQGSSSGGKDRVSYV